MKTLKSVLAMALAATMLIGMMVMASSAVVLKDEATIVNKEAVGVLTGLGIINGVPAADGSYSYLPTASISRAEAAKIIANVVAGYDVKELKVTEQVFDDVATTAWYAPYVHFCASKGIVSGWNGKFAPADPVTPYALGKMILVANGYKGTDFEGTLWESEVSMIGRDIFKGVATSGAVNATRDEAAAYLYNGFTKISKVLWNKWTERYEDDTTATTILNDNYDVTSGTAGVITANSTNTANSKVTVVGGTTYDVNTGVELLGHYVKVWYSDPAANGYTYSAPGAATNDKVLYVQDLSTVVTVATATTNATTWKAAFGTATITNAGNVDANGATAGTGITLGTVAPAGTYVLYQNDIKSFTAPISYSVTKVNDITTTAGSEAIVLDNGTDPDITLANNATSDVVVEFAGVKKNDLVAYSVNGSVYTLYPVTVKEGVIASVTGSNAKYNLADGTVLTATAPVANNTGKALLTIDGTTNKWTSTYKFYLDPTGKVFGMEAKSTTSTTSSVVYVLDSYSQTVATTYGTATYNYAQCVDMNGNEVTYKTAALLTGGDLGVFKKATVDSTTGLATFTNPAVATDKAAVIEIAADKKLAAADLKIADGYYYAAGVKFVFVDATAKASANKAASTTVKVGLDAVKNYVIDMTEAVEDDPATGEDETAAAVPAYVLVYVADGSVTNKVVNTVMVIQKWADPNAAGTGHVYVANTAVTGTNANGNTYEAYVNGVKQTITATGVSGTGYYSYTVTAKGVYALAAATATHAEGAISNNYNGLLTVAGGTVTDFNANGAIVVNLSGNAKAPTTVAGLKTTETVSVVYNATAKTISHIYITASTAA